MTLLLDSLARILSSRGRSVRCKVMRATDFEYRHQTLLHLLIVTASFLTYFVDRNDIVWALVQGQAHRELLERLLFTVATILIGVSTVVRTWARACPGSPILGHTPPLPRDGPYRYLPYPQRLGNLLFSIGLGFLAPLSGFVVLVAGEAIIFLRLIRREKEVTRTSLSMSQPLPSREPLFAVGPTWGQAFRQESAKWGLFVTMIVFTLLLRDRVAEVLAAVSFVVWVLLNWRSFQTMASR
jgi:Na+-transporting NADH:ubiquinone oxidoreductase subunit NqrB